MKALSAALLVAIALAGCASVPPERLAAEAAPVAAETSVFIVRHLQKAQGDDPSLTAEGAAGAQRLAEMLEDKAITAIFATPTRRAMETAAPLAKRLGIPVTPYDPGNPQALATAAAAAAGSVLVVGHSNTVPDLVALFGGSRPAPLTEADYGTVFVVDRDHQVTSFELR